MTGFVHWARSELKGQFDWAWPDLMFPFGCEWRSDWICYWVVTVVFDLTGQFDWARSNLTGPLDWARSQSPHLDCFVLSISIDE